MTLILQSHSSHGIDGLPADFYEHFGHSLYKDRTFMLFVNLLMMEYYRCPVNEWFYPYYLKK